MAKINLPEGYSLITQTFESPEQPFVLECTILRKDGVIVLLQPLEYHSDKKVREVMRQIKAARARRK